MDKKKTTSYLYFPKSSHHHEEHEHHHNSHHFKDDIIRDPLKVMQGAASEDYYSLCWCALKKKVWEDKKVYGVHIFLTDSNYRHLIADFFIFAALISFTITVMLH